MRLARLKVNNFKALTDVDMTFTPLTFLVGPNASGKSSVLQVFQFLRTRATYGIPGAIRAFGGVRWLPNMLRAQTPVQIEVWWEDVDGAIPGGWTYDQVSYHLEFLVGDPPHVTERLEYNRLSDDHSEMVTDPLTISRIDDGRLTVNGPPAVTTAAFPDSLVDAYNEMTSGDGTPLSMLHAPWASAVWTWLVYGARFYDVDPRWSRLPDRPDGNPLLGPWGDNLPAALEDLRNHPAQFSAFERSIRRMLPFAGEIRITPHEDGTIDWALMDQVAGDRLPSTHLSAGTVQLITLMAGLYQDPESAPFYGLEEPERYLHPHLQESLMDALRDLAESWSCMIVLATQSPVLLQTAHWKEIWTFRRDDAGSHVRNLADLRRNHEAFGQFLAEMGLGEAFIGGILEASPR